MRYGSLFSGIGGFDLGLDRAGMECAWQCEIEPFPVRVLERHWPQVPKYGDIREVDPHGLGRVDLVCGGSPCQDVSVAGKRAGLAGERSGLFFEFVRIADAVAPKWILFENVPGLLSSNRGEDFAVVLEEFTGFRPTVPRDGWRNSGVCVGPKRGATWRVLDAQYFGVAQRRRRVFIVASAGDGRGPAEVLFEPESGAGHSPPRREAGQVSASLLASGAGTDRPAGIGSETDFLVAQAVDVRNFTENGDLSGTLQSKKSGGYSLNYQNPVMVAKTLSASNQRIDYETETFVLQDVRGLRDKKQNGIGVSEGDGPMYTLDATQQRAVAFVQNQRNEVRLFGGDGDTVGALASEPGTKQQTYVAFEARIARNGAVPALRRETHYGDSTPLIAGATVRRLTPRECERLQGFPDDWTLLDKSADGPRYRALGNAVCRNVAEWLGHRIQAVDEAGP